MTRRHTSDRQEVEATVLELGARSPAAILQARSGKPALPGRPRRPVVSQETTVPEPDAPVGGRYPRELIAVPCACSPRPAAAELT